MVILAFLWLVLTAVPFGWWKLRVLSVAAMSFLQAMSQPKMGIGGAMPFSTFGSSSIQLPFLPTLDHSKGQWFMPGEELPAGFVATSHPDGHLTPLPEHAMSRKARQSLGLDGTEPNFGMAGSDEKPEKSPKKSSRKKKNSGCC